MGVEVVRVVVEWDGRAIVVAIGQVVAVKL